VTRAADKRASVPYEVRGTGRYPRLPEDEKRRRKKERAHRAKVAAALRGEKLDKRKARPRPDKPAGGRPPGNGVDARVELREHFERRAKVAPGMMRSNGLFSGYGLLLPFAPTMPWTGDAETLQGMPPSAAGGG
jgi:hypothetical protein